MCETNKFNLPVSHRKIYESYILPKNIKNLGIISDAHIPYHSIEALEEAIEYFIIKRVDAILFNGDMIDCFMLSKYQPDPRERDFGEEIFAFHEFIASIKKIFPGIPLFYKMGNHEERYEKFMIRQCPQLLKIDKFNFEEIMGCREAGINIIKDQRTVYAGKCPIFHGHELGLKSVAVNPARSLFLKIHANGICSHLHRTSQHTEPSIKEPISCYSTGHLGDPHPKYMVINRWNHGAARVELNEDGDYEVINFGLKRNQLFAGIN